ncbi:MAG TPA: SGNH/GDSL hydrolase family protein [Coleofasciculaceae cyanobacterium]
MGFDVVRNRHSVKRMGDRRLRSATNFFRFSPVALQMQLLPRWVFISLAGNGLLAIAVVLMLGRSLLLPTTSPASAAMAVSPQPDSPTTDPSAATGLGGVRHLTYQQWVDQLRQEANVAATQKPAHLTILAGDSISLWFPQDLLPADRSWLNQGISGETSTGLLKRLNLFDATKPETIFVMIGINDLIKGNDNQTLLDNQEKIIRDLKTNHPKAQIVVQSILPHGGDPIKWEGRDRLLAVPASRIQTLNQELEAIAKQEGVYFLDLYSLFADPQGNLRPDLTTDGLHLNPQGYRIWSVALQVYSREVLEPDLQAGG